MQQRRGTAAQWISTNDGNGPILAIGEIGYESDTNKFKIGDGVNHWVDLSYFVDLETTIAGAPGLLNSLDELAAAIGDDPSFFTTVGTNLSAHTSATTDVHGIADTDELATKTYVTDAIGNATVDQSALAGDGISWNTGTEQFDVDNTVVRSADLQELAQDAIGNVVGNGLSYNDSTGTISVDGSVYQARVTNVSDTEIGYLDGVTSAIQTQIDSKAPIASPTFTGTVSGITKSMVGLSNVDNTSDANKQISDATQAALDLKAPINSPTFTGTVSGITKAMVGLTNAQDTSDANKPVSTATQAALDLKAPLASPALTGTATAEDLTVSNNLIVDGNLTVSGTTTTVSTANFTTADALIYLGEGNSANIVDLGIVSSFDDGTYQHSGIVRDSSAGKWKLFKGVTDEPTTTVNFSQGSLDDLAVGALEASSLTVGSISNTEFGYLDGLTGNIQDQLGAKLNAAIASTTYAPLSAPTFTGTVSGITKSMVGLGNVDNTSDANKGISTATQSALDLKAPLADPTFTGTVTLPAGTVTSGMILNGTIVDADINSSAAIAWTKIAPSSTVSETELGYLDGVTSAIQTQIDSKISSVDAASTYQTKVSGVSNAEISYLDGVTSAIQDQIDLKAPLASPTFTGTVSGVTKSMVGLGNVDNTTDAAKPVSTATQTALDLKAPLASPTFTGTVSGITKSMVGLSAVDNTSDANKPVSTATQTALDLKAPLASPTFTGTVTLPTGTVTSGMILDGTIVAGDLADGAVTSAKILDGTIVNGDINASAAIDWTKLAISSTVSATELGYVDGVTSAIQTQIDSKLASSTASTTYAPIASPTFTGAVTLPGAPTSALHAATKQYVDDVTAGLNFHESVVVATTANIAGTYSNGTSGVGATITVTATGVLTIDGVATALNDRILVKDQTTASQNGIYKVTTAGATGVSAVLTRATDADNSPAGELKTGDFVFASSGTTNGGYGFVNNTSGSITIGTTSVSYTTFNTAQAIIAGTGLTESTPGTLAIDSTVVTLTGNQTLTSKTLTAPVLTNANLNTPTAVTLTNGTGLPVSTGISGLGTGIATALAVNVGSAGAPLVNGGVLGTPSSGTLTNATGLPVSTGISGLGTGVATFLATPSSANFASMITDEVGTGSVVLSEIATSAQTASYTLVAADRAKLVEMNVASANTITVPPNSSVAFPVGTKIDVLQVGAGQTTVTAGAGVTVNGTPGLKLRAQWSSVTLIKRATDTWVVVGDLTA